MVGLLAVFVGVLAILCLGNLLLTFAVLHRLRLHEQRWASFGLTEPDLDTLTGRRLSTSLDAVGAEDKPSPSGGARLVGLFSAGCTACVEQAREFARVPEADRVALVVMGAAERHEQRELLGALDGAPSILPEPVSRAVAEELGVRSYPVLLWVDESGVVVRAQHSLASLAAATMTAS
jgi:hypothetical protein